MASTDDMIVVVSPRPTERTFKRHSKQTKLKHNNIHDNNSKNKKKDNNNNNIIDDTQTKPKLLDLTQDDVTLYHRLGTGASGEVFVSVIRPTRQAAAVKLVSKHSLANNHRAALRIHREARIQAVLDHPHICKLYSHIETDTHHCLVMQYARNGDLLQLLRNGGKLSFAESRRMMKQLVSAVSHMHRKGFVHRDIKPENILLDHKHDVLLADFGFACKWSTTRFQRDSCGSLHYAAPEVVRNEHVRGPEADVWSCGAVFVAMLTASLPFNGKNGYETLGYMETRGFVRTPAMTADTLLWDLLCGMLEPDVERRLTLKQVRKHPWMTQDEGVGKVKSKVKGMKLDASSSSSTSSSCSTGRILRDTNIQSTTTTTEVSS